jgi:hypothetical protein
MFGRLGVAVVGVVSDGRIAVAATKGRKLLLATLEQQQQQANRIQSPGCARRGLLQQICRIGELLRQNFFCIPFAGYGRFHCFLGILCATDSNDSVLPSGRTGRRRPGRRT